MSISPSEKIKVSIEGNIATVMIDNPSANTWDRESLPALKAVVEALNAEPTVYALVLTGAGEKFFSAGADLNQFASEKAAADFEEKRYINGQHQARYSTRAKDTVTSSRNLFG